VQLAEEAFAAAPSTATRSGLMHALLFRASQAMEKQEPAYAAMAKRARKSLDSDELLAIAVYRHEKLRAAILKNPDVQSALTLMKEGELAFPNDPGVVAYVLLRAAKAPEADHIMQVLRTEYEQLQYELARRLSPLSAQTAFASYFLFQAIGEEA